MRPTLPALAASYIAVLFGGLLVTPAYAQHPPSPAEWLTDLQYIAEAIETIHPNPYHQDTEDEFKTAIAALAADITHLADDTIAVRLMQAVATLRDGHTMVRSFGQMGFGAWYPVRFRVFPDGLFITVIDSTYAEYTGARVSRLGDLSSEEAVALVGTVVAADNEFSRENFIPLWMSNATIMSTLGITSSADSLDLEVTTEAGERVALSLPAIRSAFDLYWFYRPLDGPPGGNYIRADEDSLPLYQRNQFTVDYMYWFEHLEEHRTLYVQFNSVADSWEETFADFTNRLWIYYEAHQSTIDKFVLDMRFNNGGNGYLLLPFIHEFIKHEEINQKGRLFTLVGKKTVSAGIVTCALMKRHTKTLLIGEPGGGPFNFYSDPALVRLPHSGIGVWIPTLYHQRGEPEDDRDYYLPDYPILTMSADYFAGRDPVLEAVLNDEVRLLTDIMLEDSAAAFFDTYRDREMAGAGVPWWEPISERELDGLGIQLIQVGQEEDAMAVFKLNAEKHPDSWRVWDHLGEAHLLAGEEGSALQCFRKSLELNPRNWNARQKIDEIIGG